MALRLIVVCLSKLKRCKDIKKTNKTSICKDNL